MSTIKITNQKTNLVDTNPDIASQPEQSAQSNYIAAMQQQVTRHEDEYNGSVIAWNKLYNDLLAEKDNLYKADPKLAEAKRKEAALKTLISAFGGIADTFNVAYGGTAPVRDYRADIYQTHHQADALDQSERAKESAAKQNWFKQLEEVWDKRPKWTKNDAALQLYKLYADEEKQGLIASNRLKLQKDQQQFKTGENEKNRKAKKEIEDSKNGKQKKIINPLNNGEIWLNENFFDDTNIAVIVQQIIDKYGVQKSELRKIKKDAVEQLTELYKDEKISLEEYHKLYEDAIDINKYTKSDLGRLLQMYPEAANILMEHDTRGGEYTKHIAAPKPYNRNGVVNFKTNSGTNVPASTNPIDQPADTTQRQKTYRGVPKI
jgi:hypothetical protein